ncbi:MAG: PA0069 family radical SAM protein [Gemmataceae bacterium]
MSQHQQPIRGRGASNNPANRFATVEYEIDPDTALDEDDLPAPHTEFYADDSRTIITENQSPDVGFDFSINPYRGCEHGCVYCYARPTHEFLGFSAGLDFEMRIMVKQNAASLLRKELSSSKWKPKVLGFSSVTDPYQPIERSLKLTRGCLEVLAEFRNPVAIITKNRLVTRDIDLLLELAEHNAAKVFVSITTLNGDLRQKLEPRTSHHEGRLAAIEELTKAGITAGVMVAPIIPGLTESEMPSILEAAARVGAKFAGYTVLRLPGAVDRLFSQWLEDHFPNHKKKVLGRVETLHGGERDDNRFGVRMRGEGVIADLISQMFQVTCKKLGLNPQPFQLSTEAFRTPGYNQLSLFED